LLFDHQSLNDFGVDIVAIAYIMNTQTQWLKGAKYMSSKFISELEKVFAYFKESLQNTYNAQCTNETELRRIFFEQLPDWLVEQIDRDIDSGVFLEEIYGDEILSCFEFKDDD
jgi:hypothetical protein